MSRLLLNEHLNMTGSLKLRSNGDGAKTAPVNLVAYAGGVIDYPGIGPIVFDIASMRVKSRIPLDYGHDPDSAIGYLSNFDTKGNTVIEAGGAITRMDSTSDLLANMGAGVPYEASIEGWNYTLELVDVGEVAHVNGQDFEGPLFVVRDWDLKAVAVCKFGRDSNTSTVLSLSHEKSTTPKKVLFAPVAKELSMSKEITPEDKAVEAEVVAEAAAEVKAEEVVLVDEKEGEVKADEPAVEAVAEVETVEAEAPVAVAASADVKPVVEAVDPRSEFKQFVAAFGDKAAEFYAEGLSFADASAKFVLSLKAENDDLKKRLTASDMGAAKPITFKDTGSDTAVYAAKSMTDLIRKRERN